MPTTTTLPALRKVARRDDVADLAVVQAFAHLPWISAVIGRDNVGGWDPLSCSGPHRSAWRLTGYRLVGQVGNRAVYVFRFDDSGRATYCAGWIRTDGPHVSLNLTASDYQDGAERTRAGAEERAAEHLRTWEEHEAAEGERMAAALAAATGDVLHELTPDGAACGITTEQTAGMVAVTLDPAEVTCKACTSGEPSNEITDDGDQDDDEDQDDVPAYAGPFWCADCGKTDAVDYVVTFLDGDQEDRTARTEVCLPCHEADALAEQADKPVQPGPVLAATLRQLAAQIGAVTDAARDRSGDYLAALVGLRVDLDALADGTLPPRLG